MILQTRGRHYGSICDVVTNKQSFRAYEMFHNAALKGLFCVGQNFDVVSALKRTKLATFKHSYYTNNILFYSIVFKM